MQFRFEWREYCEKSLILRKLKIPEKIILELSRCTDFFQMPISSIRGNYSPLYSFSRCPTKKLGTVVHTVTCTVQVAHAVICTLTKLCTRICAHLKAHHLVMTRARRVRAQLVGFTSSIESNRSMTPGEQ